MNTDLTLPFLKVRHPYTDPLERQRAQMLLYMIAIVGATWLVATIFVVIPSLADTPNPTPLLFTFSVPLVLFAIYRLMESGRILVAAALFIVMLLLVVVPYAVLQPGTLFLAFLLVIPLTAAGALFNRIGALIVFAIVLIALLLRSVGLTGITTVTRYIPAVNGAEEIAFSAVVIVTSAVFLIGFSGTTERIAQGSLDDLRHWQSFAKLKLQSETDPDRLAGSLIEILQGDLSYTLAQIYFADESGYVTRRVRKGATDRQFTMRIDDLPVIGDVAREKRGRAFRRDMSASQDYPLAPARIGIAMPILYQGIVLGILDAQTQRGEYPSQSQLAAFTSVTESLADLLMNARRTVELQKTVDDQEGVIATFRTRLTELQSRGAQAVSSSWVRYLEGRGGTAFGFDVDTPEGKAIPRAAADLPAAIRATLERGDLFVEPNADGSNTVHVPILLREEVLGGMTFTVPAGRPMNNRQLDTLRTIASRLGQSLENNRLFEQSQAQAARERKANEVNAQLISATNVESLLELAASSFNDALGAVYTRVFIDPSAVSGDQPSSASSNGTASNGAHTNGANGATGAHERS